MPRFVGAGGGNNFGAVARKPRFTAKLLQMRRDLAAPDRLAP
jgi:hypothetical protein